MRFQFTPAVLGLCLLAAESGAQSASDREGTWEAGFRLIDGSSVSLNGSVGASLDIESELGYGFFGNYNFTDRLAAGVDLNWTSPDYTATFVPDGAGDPQTITTSLDVATVHAKGIFYFLEGDVAPYFEAGFGWTSVDSNVVDGPPLTGCWWDPWWGYICASFYETYSQTQTSYSAAFGLRWDMSPDMMIRASAGKFEINTDATEDASLDIIQLEFAWRF
jgi:hypothetical protein